MAHHFRLGSIPILISIPHHGSYIPPEIAETMTADGRSSRDTDWFLERLYDLPETREASWLVADWSRYVIDLNRPASGESLYPGQATTGLVPETCFDGAAIYENDPPSPEALAIRLQQVWHPYHLELQRELERLSSLYPKVLLLEAHSIKSVIPRLFPGKLPDFNIGTNHGNACSPELQSRIVECLASQDRYSFVVNGRFVGGYITRHYGRPDQGVHAIQIELSQDTYLDERDLTWDDQKAGNVQPIFRSLIAHAIDWLTE